MAVYFIIEYEQGRESLKIGRSKDVPKRVANLQTGNPVELKLIGWINAENDAALERELHIQFDKKRIIREWFAMQPADVLPAMMRAGIKGFVAKNADAFEIVGYDKDAIPECIGVWEWSDLEYYECCPFCGCLCGMHFQDASNMYHCLNCGELTDFEDDPGPEDDE